MHNRIRGICLRAGLLTAFAEAPALSSTITIDGDMSDWGVTVADNNGSDFSSPNPTSDWSRALPKTPMILPATAAMWAPNYGGQNYDAEFMDMALQGNTMYLAIVTGQRPDNGLKRYSPGDIYLTTPEGVFGIEVGDGPGGGDGSLITEGAEGSTYNLRSNGYTQSYGTTDVAQTAGSIWKDADWIIDPLGAPTPVQISINGASTMIGDAD